MSDKRNHIKKEKVDNGLFLDPELITDVVHKIKNGLGGIAGFAGLLERDLTPNDPKYRIVQRIYNGVISVNETVVALMNLSIVPEISLETVRLTALVKEIWANELQVENGSSDTKIKTMISGENCQIRGDRFVLQKIIFSAFKVINYTGNIITKIEIASLKGSAVLSISFQIKEGEEQGCFNKVKTIYELMKICEPVEARLNCAVLMRMLTIHGGDIEISKNKENVFTMKILLNER